MTTIAPPNDSVRTGRHRFTAMGGGCEVRATVADPSTPLDWLERVAEQLTDELEQEWSRFLADSGLSRLNADPRPVVEVSPDLAALVDLAVAAWALTGGRFDPTVADALVAAGYDRTFAEVAAATAVGELEPGARQAQHGPTPGCADVVVDLDASTVTRPPGLHLDLGGVGKGRAADLVAVELCELGAAGASVSMGGDVRVTGQGPDGSWQVAVDDPGRPGTELARVHLVDGAVATSTTLLRRWAGPDGVRHHLIDPTTAAPSTSDVVTATVVAAMCGWAEAIAKAALIAGREAGAALAEQLDLPTLLVGADGRVTTHGPWSDVATPGATS